MPKLHVGGTMLVGDAHRSVGETLGLRSWTEISQRALKANFEVLADAAGPETTLLAVVKANAYGHGIGRCVPPLVEAGARWLGVTSAAEGLAVRRALREDPPRVRVLVMCGFLLEDVPRFAEAALTPVVWTAEQVQALARAPGLPVHVEVDTGMARQGVRPGAELDALLALLEGAGLVVEGVLTHFASAEEIDSPFSHMQRTRFEAAIAQIREHGLRPAWVHAGNTSVIDNPTHDREWLAGLAATVGARAMVRTGLGLYGYALPLEGPGRGCDRPAPVVGRTLEPVLTWCARVLSVHDLAAGETVGYGATYTARGPMRAALLPVGYADGLRRELSSTDERSGVAGGGGWAMIDGLRAPILGRVSMNLTVVDASGIPGVQPGDVATILGPGITAEDHARLVGTIAYEILCGLHTEEAPELCRLHVPEPPR